MIEDVIAGKVSRIYASFQDRISRTPSLSRLIESICRNRGVDIIIINKDETADIIQTAMMELVSYATIVGARLHGSRGAMATRRELSQEQIRDAYLMKKRDGMSFKGIAREAEKRGWKDHKDRPIKGDAGWALISRRVTSQWSILESTYGKDARKTLNSFEEFTDRFISVSESNGKKPTIMPRAKIVERYSRWCDDNNKLECSPATISKVATKRGWKRKMSGKHVSYEGISINLPRAKG